MHENIGTICQVIGPVVDIQFEQEYLPDLLNAIKIENGEETLTVEVAQHIGDDVVRCIALGATDGLKRGMDAVNTGAAISVPVGNQTLGRMFNVLGEPID
ncbi:MAG: F0F1 ATP synthase subunit beta, partial [Aedoeadaptatus pacaensis]